MWAQHKAGDSFRKCVSISYSNAPSNPFDSLIHRETTTLFSLPHHFSSFLPSYICAWGSAELANRIFCSRLPRAAKKLTSRTNCSVILQMSKKQLGFLVLDSNQYNPASESGGRGRTRARKVKLGRKELSNETVISWMIRLFGCFHCCQHTLWKGLITLWLELLFSSATWSIVC